LAIVDAGLTLRYLEQGGREAHPVMALALTHGAALFMGLKMMLTGLGAWLLAAHQQFQLALCGLYGLAIGYEVLLCYHLLLIRSRA
jgi:Domain of unknown function (DUF5658)